MRFQLTTLIEMSRCKAPDDDNNRCNQLTNEYSDHCRYHFDKFNKLYSKYKKLNSKIEDINFNGQSLNDLLKSYSKIEKVIDLRIKYRNLAYIPEFHDSGHNQYIKYLFSKLTIINNLLSDKHEPIIENKIPEREEETGSQNIPSDRISRTINKLKEEKIEDDTIFEYFITLRKLEESKTRYMTFILFNLDRFLERYLQEYPNNKLDRSIVFWGIYNLNLLILDDRADKDTLYRAKINNSVREYPLYLLVSMSKLIVYSYQSLYEYLKFLLLYPERENVIFYSEFGQAKRVSLGLMDNNIALVHFETTISIEREKIKDEIRIHQPYTPLIDIKYYLTKN